MAGFSHEVQPGGLSDADHDHIIALASKGWNSGRIARRLGKHPATIGWFMYRHGLRPPRQATTAAAFTRRDGRIVRRFTRDEDDRMQALRRDGKTPTQIAAILTSEFGHPRSMHTVACRLVMLGGLEDA